MSEWKKVTLGEITDWFSGGTPAKSNEDFWNGDIPWATAKSLVKATISDAEIKITSKGLDAGSRIANVNDILLLVRGSGLYNDIPISIVTAPIAFNQDIKALRIKKDVDIEPEYVLYWLIANKRKLNSVLESTGIGAGKFDTNVIKSIEIQIPSKLERQEIIKTAYCIYTKIENLRRQNETLEAIAQTLFKHWFIDFEFPNADGKPYKSSGGAMIPSDLGEIPEGWHVGKLEDLITVNPRESIKNGEIVKYVDMKALSTSSMEITDYVTRKFTSGSKFRNQDTLLARITPCLENGKTAFVSILDNEEVAFGSTEFIVLRAKENCCPEYVYPLARSAYFRDFAVKNMTGSSGRQRIPNDVIANYKLSIPNIKTIKSYQNLCRPLFLKTSSNQKQIQTLTKTRDVLLPKLMSGQIRVIE